MSPVLHHCHACHSWLRNNVLCIMFHTRFHMLISSASLITAIRLKPKRISAQWLTCYFTSYKNITSRKVAHFSKTYYHTSLQGPQVVLMVLPPHKFGCLPLQKIKNYSIWVSSIGMQFIWTFMKIHQMVKSWNAKETAWWFQNHTFSLGRNFLISGE